MTQNPKINRPKELKIPSKTITLGCRLNAYESAVIDGHLRDHALENVIVINSCAVTKEAIRQSRQTARRARRDHPDAKIIVTGCAAQIDPQGFSDMAEIDLVLGNQEKMLSGSFDPDMLTKTERVRVNDIAQVKEIAPQLIDSGANRPLVKSQNRTRAFLQVQNGCDHRCTFCIIPFGRGGARSVPAGEVVNQIRALVAQGYKEVVLTGVDISSWGGDLPGQPPLGDLVRRVLKLVPELPRLRLSSIDPAEIDPALFEALTTETRMMPYVHLSLQAGSDMVLKRMKRRHLRADAIGLCDDLRSARPEITIGADIIAGFPTETEAMFEDSLSIIERLPISWLHVFPFSAHPQTPSAKMPQVDGAVIKARAKALRAVGDLQKRRHIEARIDDEDVALFEETGLGRLADFTLVRVENPPPAGTLGRVRLSGYSDGEAKGVMIHDR